jgi:predicted transcriptional regulator
MSIVLNLSQVDRATALNTWLTYHGIKKADLAERLGVDPSTITFIVQGRRTSGRIIQGLIDCGVPRELLPKPGPGRGRPPKKKVN